MPSVFIPPTDLSSAVPLSLGGTGATTQAGAANAVLPSQSSQNGKYLTTDGSNVSWGTVSTGVAWGSITGTLSSQTDLQNALNAKASLSGATFTGGIVSTLGSITTSTPMLSGTQQWNAVGTTFTGLKLNVTDTASGASSNLLNLQVSGTDTFWVRKDGYVFGKVFCANDFTTNTRFEYGGSGVRIYDGGTGENVNCSTGISWRQTAVIQWNGSSSTSGNYDLKLTRDGAAGVLAQFGNTGTTGAQAQTYRLYNFVTSSTNYERLGLNWTSNVAQIYTEKGSGGGTARDLVLGTNATTAITISGTDQSVTTAAALSDNIGNVRSIPQNAQTSAYVLAATDNGKHISITTGGVTVNSGIFSAGQVVVIFNNSSSNQTITQGTSVTMYQGGTTNTGNRTLASYGVATILCVASNTFVITGSGLS